MLTAVDRFSVLELCDRGEYSLAADRLGVRVGEWPSRGSQGDSKYAMALLAAGIISSTTGGIQQAGDQVSARKMLLESIALFGDDPRAHAARCWLAWSHYWSGDFDEAILLTDEILKAEIDPDTRFRAILLRVAIYSKTLQFDRAFTGLTNLAELYESSAPLLKGKFHLQRGRVLRLTDDTDRAILDYDSAIHFFQQSGNVRCQAIVTNNLAGIYIETKQFQKAHDHAERARILFRQLGDRTYEAEAWDNTALAYLAEGKVDEAWEAIHNGLSLVEYGKVLSELNLTRDKIRAQMTNDLPQSPSKGSAIMPLNCARRLADKYPDEAEAIYDLLVWAVSSDEPQHIAERDEVESIFFAKTPHGENVRKEYRRSRLIREVTSDP